jgi:hypothetical protein
MNVEQVAIDDLSAEILQELRPVVFAMRQRPSVASAEQGFRRVTAKAAARAGDQDCFGHSQSP